MITDRTPLTEYAPDERFHRLLLAVRAARISVGKNGKPFADLKVGDWSGSRSAKIWNISDAEAAALCAAQFVELTGEIDASERFAGDLKVTQYSIAPAPADVSEFLEQPRASNKHYRDRFNQLIKSVADRDMYAVLRRVFGVDRDYLRRFHRAVAAAGVHHEYPGGLLEHTVEVAELASHAAAVLAGLDRDLLVTAALLHDIGKMDEMEQELRAGEYTEDGCLIGHIVLGTLQITQAIAAHNAACADGERIPRETERALMHLILSHHGPPEHGSARKPAFAEAAVLTLCDNISAKTRQHLDLVAQNASGAVSTHNRFLEVNAYLKAPRALAPARPGGAEIDFSDSPPLPEMESDAARLLPVLGLVAAGVPDEKSEAHVSEYRRVVPPFDGADYLVQVVGDSMLDAGLREGDLLFIRAQDTARDGEIVIAHIPGDGQTVKTLRMNPRHAHGIAGPYLQPENAAAGYPLIPLREDGLIQGRVTGLLREF